MNTKRNLLYDALVGFYDAAFMQTMPTEVSRAEMRLSASATADVLTATTEIVKGLAGKCAIKRDESRTKLRQLITVDGTLRATNDENPAPRPDDDRFKHIWFAVQAFYDPDVPHKVYAEARSLIGREDAPLVTMNAEVKILRDEMDVLAFESDVKVRAALCELGQRKEAAATGYKQMKP